MPGSSLGPYPRWQAENNSFLRHITFVWALMVAELRECSRVKRINTYTSRAQGLRWRYHLC